MDIMKRKYNAATLASYNPTFIGQVGEYRFYEHPILGDEAPLVVRDAANNWGLSHWYDLPSHDELYSL